VIPTKTGDVVIQISNDAPSLATVGRVLDDGAQVGDHSEVVAGRKAAQQRARELVAPGGRIFMSFNEDDWVESP
jgi:hypothetical protein